VIIIIDQEEKVEVAISSIIKRNNTEMIIKKAVTHNIKTKGLNTSQETRMSNREDSNKVGEITNIAKEEKVIIEAVMVRTNNIMREVVMKRRTTSQEITTTVNSHQRKITDNIIMINKEDNLQKTAILQIKNNRRNSMEKKLLT
tara:strand:+ start:1981 stop:2412 length:432 start_codon:yes stop_codon:yes gene_type:complete